MSVQNVWVRGYWMRAGNPGAQAGSWANLGNLAGGTPGQNVAGTGTAVWTTSAAGQLTSQVIAFDFSPVLAVGSPGMPITMACRCWASQAGRFNLALTGVKTDPATGWPAIADIGGAYLPGQNWSLPTSAALLSTTLTNTAAWDWSEYPQRTVAVELRFERNPSGGGSNTVSVDFVDLMVPATVPAPPSAAKRWDGTDWVPATVKAWDGNNWAPAKVWDGNNWVAL